SLSTSKETCTKRSGEQDRSLSTSKLNLKRLNSSQSRFVAVFLQVPHEGRAAGAVRGAVGTYGRLFLNVARSVFEVGGAEGFHQADAGVVYLAQRPIGG